MPYTYNAKKLPPGFTWVCAIARPEGYNGHAIVCNVAKDPNGQHWGMSEHGRWPMAPDQMKRWKISEKPLKQAPFTFDPV